MARAIAFFGDLHGFHDRMVRAVREWQERAKQRIGLIVCAGDFHAVRNEEDRKAMVSALYRKRRGDFVDYFRGRKRFPAEVLFIGGNHEPYNLLETLPRGGLVGPNCRYLGRYGVLERFGLRFAGLTGIFSPKAYPRGRLPVDYADAAVLGNAQFKKQSTYFVKEEVEALSRMGPPDVLVLHEWPRQLPELARPGSLEGRAGMSINEPGRQLLEALKPRWLFCAHMHRYFRGDIDWPDGRMTTFVCLSQVISQRGGFMAVLRPDEAGEWVVESGPTFGAPEMKQEMKGTEGTQAT